MKHAQRERADEAAPLGRCELPVLRQLLRTAPPVLGEAGEKKADYHTSDFCREATFEEATHDLAPDWHR